MRIFRYHKNIYRRDGKHYLYRRALFHPNRWFNVYLHDYKSADDAAPHDHPFWFVAMAYKGTGGEHRYKEGLGVMETEWRRIRRWVPRFYRARDIHAITSIGAMDGLKTIVLHGPRVRCWCFFDGMEKGNRWVPNYQSEWSETIFPWRGKR